MDCFIECKIFECFPYIHNTKASLNYLIKYMQNVKISYIYDRLARKHFQ